MSPLEQKDCMKLLLTTDRLLGSNSETTLAGAQRDLQQEKNTSEPEDQIVLAKKLSDQTIH